MVLVPMQIMRSTLMFYTGSNILMKCKVLIKSSNNDENIMTVLSCLKMQKKISLAISLI